MKIEDIIEAMGEHITQEEVNLIYDAYQFALEHHQGQKRLNGDDFIIHPLSVAFILTDLNVDVVTICAALLHETMNKSDVTKEEISERFGDEIAMIVDAISKMNHLELPDSSSASAIYLRKVLVGLASDVRVIFIKLADRLHNLRTADALPLEKRKQKANETMSVLVPIAHRLGINSIKSELEDLSLKCLKPDVYQDIFDRLHATHEELKDVLEEMRDEISNILIEHGIKFYIKSRVKSVYSIYNKLNNGKKWSNIYDILAMRIIVDEVSDCYTVIGLIHAKYRPIPGRFKDYIAMPKENMYQSLHTGVFGSSGHRFEIQIRTWEMDEIAEKGIASHWSYKEKGHTKVQSIMEQKLEAFRNIIETNEEESDSEFATSVKNDLLNEFLYVFTPKGDVMELPKGATPIDFAYRIHSDVGDHLVGALVNDGIVPLSYELHDNDIVKVKTSKDANPRKEWLNFVKTSHAKNKIKAYFSKQTKEFYVTKGKEILEHEIRKKKLSFDSILNAENIKKICQELKLSDIQDLYFAIGSLRYTAAYIISIVTEDSDAVDATLEKVGKFERPNPLHLKSDVLVSGNGDILVHLAKCCKPVYGDDIVGYVTRGEGVRVHRKECANISSSVERMIDVLWNFDQHGLYDTDIIVSVLPGKNYLLELISKATMKNIYIDSVRTRESDQVCIYEMTVRVSHKDELLSFLESLMDLKFVKEARRK